MGYEGKRIGIIPNASDNKSIFKKVNKAPKKFKNWGINSKLFVYAGTFGAVNDLKFLVDLAAECKRLGCDYFFLAIGDGKEKSNIIQYAKLKNVLDTNLFIRDEMPKTSVFEWLVEADAVMILYSGPKIVWEDCSSNKFFDGLAAGKPIIFNIEGWGPKLAAKYSAALILNDKDMGANVRNLTEKIQDKQWVNHAEKMSKRLAKELFDRDLLAMKLEHLLRKVYDGHLSDVSKTAPNRFRL